MVELKSIIITLTAFAIAISITNFLKRKRNNY